MNRALYNSNNCSHDEGTGRDSLSLGVWLECKEFISIICPFGGCNRAGDRSFGFLDTLFSFPAFWGTAVDSTGVPRFRDFFLFVLTS